MHLDKLQQPRTMRQKGYQTFNDEYKDKNIDINEKGTCITKDGIETDRDQFGNSYVFGGDSLENSLRDSQYNTHYADGKFAQTLKNSD